MINKYFIYIFILVFSFNLKSVQDLIPKLLIKFPTRERPDKFFKCLDLYYKNLSGTIPYHFVISCDIDDQKMNCESVISKLKTYTNLSYYFSSSRGKIEAINRDIEKHLDFDILIIASDDMTPLIKGFDVIIINYMFKYFPDTDGILHFNDGRVGHILNTLPILGKKYYDRFNYVYYPGYISICCDLEMTLVSKILNKVQYINEIIIRHDHPSFGFIKDNLYYKNESKEYHKHDFDIMINRKVRNFDLNIGQDILSSTLDIHGNYRTTDWSILIPLNSSDFNTEQFKTLYVNLAKKIFESGLPDKIEILFFKSDISSLEDKKIKLIKESKGKYFSFLNYNDPINFAYNIKDSYKKVISNINLNKPVIFKK